jgi:N-acetylmuramate 1-kinase
MSLPTPMLDLTRRHLGLDARVPLALEKIEKGGSDRDFHRVRAGGAEPFILVTYGRARSENARYASIAAFLGRHGVCAPRVLFHDEAAGLLAMQDFGECDLWSFRASAWDVRRPLFESALREAHRLHGIGVAQAEAESLALEPGFDHALYRWEQKYFFDHCLGGVFATQLDPDRVAAVAAQPVWDAIAGELAARARVLVHRDFQSQNIMIHAGRAGLIDFQGMRPGLAHYDIASLLFDPRDRHLQLSEAERGALLDFYAGLGQRPDLGRDGAEFLRTFRLCAVQRMMQALGTYGFLPLKRGKTGFLKFIPPVLVNLRGVVAALPELAELAELIAPLREEAPIALEQ